MQAPLFQSWRLSFKCHIVTTLISHRDLSSRWSGKKKIICISLWRDLWDWLTSDHVSRSAEWGVYSVDTKGGKINGVFLSVCVYWRGGCCYHRMRLHSFKPFFQFAYISSCVSSSQSCTSPSLLFSYLLAIKSTFFTLLTDVGRVLTDSPWPVSFMCMLILLSSALYSLFGPFHPCSFLLLHLSSSSCLHFGGSSLACYSFPIWVTHW